MASVQVNEENGIKYGYEVWDVRLDKPDWTEIGVSQLQLTGKHDIKVTSNSQVHFYLVAPKCQLLATNRFSFLRGAEWQHTMIVCNIFETYMMHINQRETPKEIMAATVLYLLKAKDSSMIKSLK